MMNVALGKAGLYRKSAVKKQRDLFLEMKRKENPDYDFITLQELRSAINTLPKPKPLKPTRFAYNCATQRNESLDELYLGTLIGNITLWESGSTINWIARSDGYPEDGQAIEVAVRLAQATEEWNKVMDGRVRFQYVTNFDDACFKLEYGGFKGPVLAEAFKPYDYTKVLNTVYVYQLLFDPKYRVHMLGTMLHELGHVLGLRHEFAHHVVHGWGPEDVEGIFESILYGSNNPQSVMAYYMGQTIQDSDKEDIRRAYDELMDGTVISGQGKFKLVTKTIERVEPNN